jgi:hypothetical protein
MGHNPERGEVEVTFGDRTYVARPTFGAFAEIRATTGHSVLETIGALRNLDVVELAKVLGPCLRAAGAKLKDNQVGDLIVENGMDVCTNQALMLCAHIMTGGKDDLGKELGMPEEDEPRTSPTANGSATP